MIRKILSAILIFVVLFTATFTMPADIFAADNDTDVEGDSAQNDAAYLTFEVKAPKGSIVIVEGIDYKGTGIVDNDAVNTGEFGPEIFDDGVESFFPKKHTEYLNDGEYYYKVTLKDRSEELGLDNIEYDDSEYIVCVYVLDD